MEITDAKFKFIYKEQLTGIIDVCIDNTIWIYGISYYKNGDLSLPKTRTKQGYIPLVVPQGELGEVFMDKLKKAAKTAYNKARGL